MAASDSKKLRSDCDGGILGGFKRDGKRDGKRERTRERESVLI
jgi:hypothetical protein